MSEETNEHYVILGDLIDNEPLSEYNSIGLHEEIQNTNESLRETMMFIENIFELTFGDNAINRGFSYDDVTKQYKEYLKEEE